MSLLMNEDFFIYQLRLGYLNNIRDGVGERLISLNPAVLNNPAFRTAGWTPDLAAIKRCHSPPIPTGTSDINNEYFQRPRRTTSSRPDEQEGDEEGGRGMVTGHRGSEDTLGPAGLHASERKRQRRRRKEQLEEDDSSDLSDESEEETKGPAQSIKFDRMPIRSRAKSSPPTRPGTSRMTNEHNGPAVIVTHPSVRQARSDSFSAVERIKTRPRGDTVTSSEISSENEYDVGRPGKGRSVLSLGQDIKEEDEDDRELNSDLEDEEDETDIGDQVSDLTDDEFVGTVGSGSIIGIGAAAASDDISSSLIKPPSQLIVPPITPANSSPKKVAKEQLPKLPRLPPGQKLQTMAQPTSMLSMLIKGKGQPGEEAGFQRFAEFSGKGETTPLWIKIYAPFSEESEEPMEISMKKFKDTNLVTVVELIGLALYTYGEEKRQPAMKSQDCNVNRWTLRMVEDGEIEMDFPGLVRTKPVSDFTSNNNRPPNRRARDKPWDEFGLVKATDAEFKENEALTPQPSASAVTPAGLTPRLQPTKDPPQGSIAGKSVDADSSAAPAASAPFVTNNPITGRPTPIRKPTEHLDMPQQETRRGAAKTGASRTVMVYYTDPQSFTTRTEKFDTTTDTYIAEIWEQSCRRLSLDKGLHVLKVHGTQTVAPTDRLVETLGDKVNLALVRKRFLGGDFAPGSLGSVGSSTSPHTPLELSNPANATPKKSTQSTINWFNKHDNTNKTTINATTQSMLTLTEGGAGRRYNVVRKQPLSFAAPHPRTLIITPEFMTLMPAAPDSLAAPHGKMTNVAMSSIIGAKVSRRHPLSFKVYVLKGNGEHKRYDLEAKNRQEAESAVRDIRRGMEALGGAGTDVNFAGEA